MASLDLCNFVKTVSISDKNVNASVLSSQLKMVDSQYNSGLSHEILSRKESEVKFRNQTIKLGIKESILKCRFIFDSMNE